MPSGNIKVLPLAAHLIPEEKCIATSELALLTLRKKPNRNLGLSLGGGNGAALGRIAKEHCPEFMTQAGTYYVERMGDSHMGIQRHENDGEIIKILVNSM